MKVALVIPSALKFIPKDTFYSFIYAYSYLLNRLDDLPFKIDRLEIKAPSSFPIDACRNMAVAELIEDDFDTSIWFDADMVFPKNMMFRMLNNSAPIIAGMYYIKAAPFYPVVYKETEESKKDGSFTWFKPIIEYPEDAYFYADMIGMGCVKIDVKVFKEIAKTYKEKPEFFKYGINPIRIEDDQNEKHKLNKYRANYMIRDVTEDIFLWKQVKEKTDYKILVDPKIQCGHITDIISDQNLFQSFYQGKMEQLQREKPEEAEKIKEIICRAEPIKSES